MLIAPLAVTGSLTKRVIVAAVARVASLAGDAVGAWALGGAVLEPSFGVTSLRDFDASRDLSLDHLIRANVPSHQCGSPDRLNEGGAPGHQHLYCGGAIRPTTWAPGSIPGVGLSTTVSAWSGMIPISGRMVKP